MVPFDQLHIVINEVVKLPLCKKAVLNKLSTAFFPQYFDSTDVLLLENWVHVTDFINVCSIFSYQFKFVYSYNHIIVCFSTSLLSFLSHSLLTDFIAISGTIYVQSCLRTFVFITSLLLNMPSWLIHLVSFFRLQVKCHKLREDLPDHPKQINTQPPLILLFYSTYYRLTLYYEFVYYLVYGLYII